MTKRDEALQKVGPTAVTRPDYIKSGDVRGTEEIHREDIQMPRLALAQGLSPELDPTSPKYIEDLKNGDAFNTLTSEVYGRKPIEVVVVRVDRPRFIEFNPREAGGGIRDFNVPAGDPRTLFQTGEHGETIKPIATKFMEYVALLGPERQPIVLSFKGSGLKTAKTLNGLIKMAGLEVLGPDVPAFAKKFVLTPTTEKNSKGTFSLFNVKYAGVVDAETYAVAERLYEVIRDRTIVTEREEEEQREPGSDDI